MSDNKYHQVAKLILDWSIKLKKDDKLLINAYSFKSFALAKEVYKQAVKRGALPKLNISPDSLDNYFYKNASSKQLSASPDIALFTAKWADKVVNIVGETNTYELSDINPSKLTLRTKTIMPVKDVLLKKPWVLTYVPSPAMAQIAQLSLAETKEIYFNACLADYRAMRKKMIVLKKKLDKVSFIHLKGEKTDLRLYFQNRFWQICSGEFNIPDGEIFSAPLETKTEGYVYFDFPSLRQGKLVEGVSLQFAKGKVISFEASRNKSYLRESLNSDPGASKLGEFAFGLNYELKRFMYNTLFDEKIGGTIHMALGSSYPDIACGGGKNKSSIHWDFVKDMRKKGSEVYADNKLIFKEGRLLI